MEPRIELDRKRLLKYSTRALRLVEERSGDVLGELLITKASAASAAWLLWGALIHEDEAFRRRGEPTLTIDDVCDLLDEHWFAKNHTLKELWPYFGEAVVQAGLFSREGKAEPEAPNGSSASGSASGSNG